MAGNANDLTQILLDSQSITAAVRNQAEQQLKCAEETDLLQYLSLLSVEVSNHDKPELSRELAGILIKNAISGNEKHIDAARSEKWRHLTSSHVNEIKSIKEKVLIALNAPVSGVANAACQVIAKIARSELREGLWPELMPHLSTILESGNVAQQRAALTALGFICQDIALLMEDYVGEQPLMEESLKNDLLSYITKGMCSNEAAVKLAGARALVHGLLLAEEIFKRDQERNYIMNVVMETLQVQDLEVQREAWDCVVQIAAEFYPYLCQYMQQIGPRSWETIKAGPEPLVLAAMEFWNTICDQELYYVESKEINPQFDDSRCLRLVSQAKVILLPILFECMTKQNSEENSSRDSDDWTTAMAAGTCLGLCAQVLQDEVLDQTLDFVNSNFGDEDWKRREAAVLAYGYIMDGPTSNKLLPLVQQSFVHLCDALSDSSVAVRDTTAWTIGRIATYHPQCIAPFLGTGVNDSLIHRLLAQLRDEPRVASNICYAMYAIAQQAQPTRDIETGRTNIDVFFVPIATALLEAASRNDAQEHNLCASAYEAYGAVVASIGTFDSAGLSLLKTQLNQLQQWLFRTFKFNSDERIQALQGSICGAISRIVLRPECRGFVRDPLVSKDLIKCFLHILTTPVACLSLAAPDALMAIDAIAEQLGPAFKEYAGDVCLVLVKGLEEMPDEEYTRTCIQVSGDISRALGPTTSECGHALSRGLFNVLQSQASVQLKPQAMYALGDIAMALGHEFEKLLPNTFRFLRIAAQTRVGDGPVDNQEWVDYIQELRRSVLDAFAAILYASRENPKMLKEVDDSVKDMSALIALVVEDEQSWDDNVNAAIGVAGDLVDTYKAVFVPHLVQSPVFKLMQERVERSASPEIIKRFHWLTDMVSKYQK